MLNPSTLAVVEMSKTLKILQLTNDSTLIDEYHLPFKNNELIFISLSNNKKFTAVGGQNHIAVSIKSLKTNSKYNSILHLFY